MLQIAIITLITRMIFDQPFVIAQTKGFGDINSFVDLAKYTVDYEGSFSSFILNDTDGSLDVILERMKAASNQVDELFNNSLQRASLDLEIDDEVDPITHNIDRKIGYIDILYERFREYLVDFRKLNKATINDFVRVTTTDKKLALQSNLEKIYLSAVTDDSDIGNENIFEYVRQQILEGPPKEQCDNYGSIHQRLIEIYNALVVTEARGHVMTVFSYAILTQQNNESYEQQMKESAGRLVVRAEEYLLALKQELMSAPLDYRRCDPAEQVRGETYFELEGTFQMYITTEVDVNKGSCKSTCPELVDRFSETCDPDNHWCPVHRCDGIVFDCVSVNSIEVCELPRNSIQRYQWAKGINGESFGHNHGCNGKIVNPAGWWRFAYYCDVCVCTCGEENRPSTASRTINLRPKLSNIDENMIVTGVKIVLADKLLQLNIKQGKLLPGGRIDVNSEEWNRLERFRYDPEASYGGGFYLVKDNNKEEIMTVAKDYSYIWKTQHLIYLDDLYVESDYIVTGVRFNHANSELDEYNWNRSPIQLEIHVTKFNYNTGELYTRSSRWITPDDMTSFSSEYNNERNIKFVKNNENPTKMRVNLPASKPNDAIRFNPSNRVTDVGQSTIPFLDAQPVDGPVSVPLSGIGIFHKGAQGYGGYIALRTFSLNFTNYLNTAIDSETFSSYKSNFSDPIPYDIDEK